MYSVVRFTIDQGRVGELREVGEAMNQVEPGIFEGLRRAGDGFACEISTSDRWSDHVAALQRFVERHAAAIQGAVARGARVTFDVAIDADDQSAAHIALVLGFSPAILSELGAAGVGVEVTMYQSVPQAEGTSP